jgi:hypothetical protein
MLNAVLAAWPFSTSFCLPSPLQSFARNVTPSYFSDRIPTMSLQQSEAVVGELRTLGALGPDGLLLGGFWGPAGQLPARLPWVAPQM